MKSSSLIFLTGKVSWDQGPVQLGLRRNAWPFAFLRSKIKEKMPTWKRLKIVQGLIWYRNNVRKSDRPKLEHIRSKLRAMAAKEREVESEAASTEAAIDGIVGKINPCESDVIQALRRAIRVIGRKFNTEKAYVGKVCAFMEHLSTSASIFE